MVARNRIPPVYGHGLVQRFDPSELLEPLGLEMGIGMFGFLMPSVASVHIVSLFLAQRRAKKVGLIQPKKGIEWRRAHWLVYDFCFAVDLGGIIILSGGAALILVPCSLAAVTLRNRQTNRQGP